MLLAVMVTWQDLFGKTELQRFKEILKIPAELLLKLNGILAVREDVFLNNKTIEGFSARVWYFTVAGMRFS